MNMVSFKMMIYPFTYLLPHTLFLSLFECDFLTLGTTYDVPKEPFVDGMPYGLYLTSDKFIPSNQVCGLKQIIFDVVCSYNCKRSNTFGLYACTTCTIVQCSSQILYCRFVSNKCSFQ